MSVFNVGQLAVAFRDNDPVAKSTLDIVDRVLTDRDYAKKGWTAKEMNDIAVAYCMAKRKPHESVAQAMGRLAGPENDWTLAKIFNAENALKMRGQVGEEKYSLADLEKRRDFIAITGEKGVVAEVADAPRMTASPFGNA